MSVRVGVAIARRAGAVAVVDVRRGRPFGAPILTAEQERRGSCGEILRELLQKVPGSSRKAPLAVALSDGDFACAETVPAGPSIRPRDLVRIAPSIAEAECAGETLEELAVDAAVLGKTLLAAALRRETLAEIRRVAAEAGVHLELVTAVPVALAAMLADGKSLELSWGGERTEAKREAGAVSWRSHPMDSGDQDAGGGAPAAVAAAACDPESVPNLLRGAPDAPRSFGGRFRRPLLGLAGTSALLVLALGLEFRATRARVEMEKARASVLERELWAKYLPSEKERPGQLLWTVRERLRAAGAGGGGPAYPSAFLFWHEIARRIPEADELGMTLETLDLSPEGGRLSAVVSAVPGDPLRNAALLEAKLGQSQVMTARGDYEARAKDVQVRLRMDYRPGRAP